jgi:hypothetical protein
MSRPKEQERRVLALKIESLVLGRQSLVNFNGQRSHSFAAHG